MPPHHPHSETLTHVHWQQVTLPLPDGRQQPLQVLRLDRCDALAPGNKIFKLSGLLRTARQRECRRLLSFGGPWSNHLHALAALGREMDLQTVGLVRGEDLATPTLVEAAGWGMALYPLSRSLYRQRHDPAFQLACMQDYRADMLIPEGGDCPEGARGCQVIGAAIRQRFESGAQVVVATGTGTTLAGIVAGLDKRFQVLGISALKGALDTQQRILANLQALAGDNDETLADWRLYHEFHCGGFARTNSELRAVIAWGDHHGLPLEPVYTGKALLALRSLLSSGDIDAGRPLVLVHTGGLQGRRGFDWLALGAQPGH
ncbi:pyridoxal-phosphate dependent enzyme [Parahaliea aestuarii]